MRRQGAIPSQIIQEFLDNGSITSELSVPAKNLQPASLDLRLGTRGHRVRAAFLPKAGETIEEALKATAEESFDLTASTVLKLNHTYVLELMESFSLPESVHAYTNNKSSTGRTNIWVRTLVDRLPRFDKIPPGYRGKAYVMITPRSWPIRVSTGVCLNQARFLLGDNRLSDLELEMAHQKVGLVYDREGRKLSPEFDKGLLLSVDLDQPVVGYEAIASMQVVDLTSPEAHPAEEFFRPLEPSGHQEVLLRRDHFYIMCTREFLRVPPMHAVEMVAYDIHSGEFRSHYAGFFDPGFGYGQEGEVLGTPAVLEVAPHEDVLFRHGQPICKMVYESLLKEPDKIYGVDIKSHYMHQRGPQLGRYFTYPAALSC